MAEIDHTFTALPLRALCDAALGRARELGAEHAELRVERVRGQRLRMYDARLVGCPDEEEVGLSVRVVKDGTWGFAADVVLTPAAAVLAAERAVRMAAMSAPVNTERIELAPEPCHGERTWVSSYDVDPLEVPVADKTALLADWSARLLADPRVAHVHGFLTQVRENKFYADLSGTVTTQQRVRIAPVLRAVAVADGVSDSMRTLAPPVGRGWEYLTGTGWDFDAELAELPELLAAKLAAPSVRPGRYDLVIDPSNLWLPIHESIGHATELDRALGYEAAFAGTSFATPDRLGELRYGSPAMHVTGDRTVEHGLATVGFDDEGVAAQRFDIVSGGVLTGFQLDRRTAALGPGAPGAARSNGCAYADGPSSVPLQRMANVSLLPDPAGPSTAELIAGVADGIYVVGDRGWSIDMQRYNFQFTGQRFYRIRGGRLAGQLRDVAYQAVTTEFWNAMEAVGGPPTYVLGGVLYCGKGQPGQAAPVSHGCPSALFRQVNVLNTSEESGS